jgi:hypothetical protein
MYKSVSTGGIIIIFKIPNQAIASTPSAPRPTTADPEAVKHLGIHNTTPVQAA